MLSIHGCRLNSGQMPVRRHQSLDKPLSPARRRSAAVSRRAASRPSADGCVSSCLRAPADDYATLSFPFAQSTTHTPSRRASAAQQPSQLTPTPLQTQEASASRPTDSAGSKRRRTGSLRSSCSTSGLTAPALTETIAPLLLAEPLETQLATQASPRISDRIDVVWYFKFTQR